MLFSLFNEPVSMFISYSAFFALLMTAIISTRWSFGSIPTQALIHSVYPALGFIIGGLTGLSIQNGSLGVVYGGANEPAILFIHFSMMYAISFTILLLSGMRRKPKIAES